ncbi:MAG: helix-turn-helix transcriptional regulator [Deltaproteobacteria bacterium]|nr:helix-turn-helix transcriptional regulator [Deltaproteobacteria bacterium]
MSRVAGETPSAVIDDVGRKIAELRRERGWTQQEAAEQLRMPLKNFQRVEAGMNLTIRTLVRIARGLDVPTRTLFDPPNRREKRRRGRPRRSD